MLLTADVGGNELTQLYVLSGDGATFTTLTDRPEVIHTSAQWSPDGKRIAYSSNERDRRYFDLYERTSEDGNVKRILTEDGTNHVMRYSPDGQQVLFGRYESNIRDQLFLLNGATGEVRSLTPEIHEGPAVHAFPSWSADRKG